ncbi:MAG: hypothetical protein MZU95_15545 [Desulfomicrobium escambiense]|nr:hypothetical protein [Desulfomicrobium escambiense]
MFRFRQGNELLDAHLPDGPGDRTFPGRPDPWCGGMRTPRDPHAGFGGAGAAAGSDGAGPSGPASPGTRPPSSRTSPSPPPTRPEPPGIRWDFESILGDTGAGDRYAAVDSDAWNLLLIRLTDGRDAGRAAEGLGAAIGGGTSGIDLRFRLALGGRGAGGPFPLSPAGFYQRDRLHRGGPSPHLHHYEHPGHLDHRADPRNRDDAGHRRRPRIRARHDPLGDFDGLPGLRSPRRPGGLPLPWAPWAGQASPAPTKSSGPSSGGAVFRPFVTTSAVVNALAAMAAVGPASRRYPIAVALRIPPVRAMPESLKEKKS